MAKITYENKVALNVNSDVADVNKCNATDLNEIKQVVNENDDLVGILENLTTQDKTSIVNAINEVNQNDIRRSTYTTSEQVIGKWIDGKPLYRKTITFTSTISANTTTSIAHNIINAKNIFIDYGASFMEANIGESNYLSYGLPLIGYDNSTNDKVFCYVNPTDINFYANGNWAGNWTKHITLKYTKTTD